MKEHVERNIAMNIHGLQTKHHMKENIKNKTPTQQKLMRSSSQL